MRTLKFFLFVTAVSFASAAFSEISDIWKVKRDFGDFVFHLDPASAKKKDNIIKVWTMRSFKKEQQVGAFTYLSIKQLVEYDCENDASRIIHYAIYSSGAGNGSPLNSDSIDDRKWLPAIPGSIGASIVEFICR